VKNGGKRGAETKKDYLEALNDYLAIKAKYERKVRDAKRSAFARAATKKKGFRAAASVLPQCVQCMRNVGTNFSETDKAFSAVCGDAEAPCGLNIQLFRGYNAHFEDTLSGYADDLEKCKQTIIQLKMDTIFNYATEAQAAADFKRELDEYTSTSEIYKELLDIYNDLYNNMHKRELLKRKTERVQELMFEMNEMLDEYAKSGNAKSLETAMHVYVSAIAPEIEGIRRTKFDIVEVSPNMYAEHEHILVQREGPLSKYTFQLKSEPPRVVKFDYHLSGAR
jgi:hypothetical protein